MTKELNMLAIDCQKASEGYMDKFETDIDELNDVENHI